MDLPKGIKLSELPPHGFVFVLFTLSKHLCGPSGSICVYNLYYQTSSLMCVEEPSPVACMVIAYMCVCLCVKTFL